MEIRTMPLAKLFPADYNPRKSLKAGDPEYEKLRQSVETFGLVEPLIWNEATGRLVGGHQRLTVLRDMGVEEVSVSVVSLDEDHEKALNVALNKISGEWDNDALASILRDLESSDLSYLTGFDEVDLEALVGEKASADNGMSSDAIDLPEITKPGDIWLLGSHRLMCGDSCNPEHVDRLMDGERARLVVTDPPYNVDYESKVEIQAFSSSVRATSHIENDKMDSASFRAFLSDAYRQMYRAMQPGAAIYVFHSDVEGIVFRECLAEAGFKLAACLIWVKSALVLSRSDYQWRHEPILYGWRPDGTHKWYGGRKKTTVVQSGGGGVTIEDRKDGSAVLTFSDGLRAVSVLARDYEVLEDGKDILSSVIYHEKPSSSELHPTMKPVELVSKLIRNSSRRGDLVADFFGGSGTTLIACEENARACCMMEFDSHYCDVIVRRYLDCCGRNDAVLLRGNERMPYSEVS